jgi:thiamine-phosphate pyrophosphorylase
LGDSFLAGQVEEAVRSGATFVQLREKNLDYDGYMRLAGEVKRVTDRNHIPFVVNDDVDVAIACGADGVHVGQQDMEAGDVRRLLGDKRILGVSVQTVEQALAAERKGANYLGVGAVFSTSTKQDAELVPFSTLKEICAAVSIPVVAIGGICRENVHELSGSGISGIAVVSSIFAQPDIAAATAELRRLAGKVVGI